MQSWFEAAGISRSRLVKWNVQEPQLIIWLIIPVKYFYSWDYLSNHKTLMSHFKYLFKVMIRFQLCKHQHSILASRISPVKDCLRYTYKQSFLKITHECFSSSIANLDTWIAAFQLIFSIAFPHNVPRHLPISISHWQLQFISFPTSNEKNVKQEDAFKEVITSCRSLSSFETNSLKIALPQVRKRKLDTLVCFEEFFIFLLATMASCN